MLNRLQSSRVKRLLDELDWDCQDNLHHKNSLNVVHWYPASFITSIPGNIIDIFSEPGDTIWDPFCGCGTTAFESYRKGRNTIGNDINEIAVHIAQSKLDLLKYSNNIDEEFKKLISEIEKLEFNFSFHVENKEYLEIAEAISSVKNLFFWYNSKTFKDLLVLRGLLEKYKCDIIFKNIFLVVFLNIAKVACAQKKTWGHIADNCLPNKDQLSKNNQNVFLSYTNKLYQVLNQVHKIFFIPSNTQYQILVEDAQTYCPPFPVDLVITSPPYPSMADYITSQRLDFYWLGYKKEELNFFKKKEIGARYRRHNKQRNLLYSQKMKMCIKNIINNIKSEGLFVLVLPEYNSTDSR